MMKNVLETEREMLPSNILNTDSPRLVTNNSVTPRLESVSDIENDNEETIPDYPEIRLETITKQSSIETPMETKLNSPRQDGP